MSVVTGQCFLSDHDCGICHVDDVGHNFNLLPNPSKPIR